MSKARMKVGPRSDVPEAIDQVTLHIAMLTRPTPVVLWHLRHFLGKSEEIGPQEGRMLATSDPFRVFLS
jgi:hypothetical protein